MLTLSDVTLVCLPLLSQHAPALVRGRVLSCNSISTLEDKKANKSSEKVILIN